jgi:hypothetical protein
VIIIVTAEAAEYFWNHRICDETRVASHVMRLEPHSRSPYHHKCIRQRFPIPCLLTFAELAFVRRYEGFGKHLGGATVFRVASR